MGDPLSVAGTAVGVVSLGLQVTGGLIKYYSNFKSYHDDIAQITQSSERLCELLEYLKDVLRKEEPEHSAVLEQVRRSVGACDGGLRLLKREVDKNRTVKLPVNTEDKARMIVKRLLYPFKKDTLYGVQVQLYALEDRLSFAVNLWNREISSTTFEVVTVIGRTTQSVDRRAQIIEEKLDRIISRMEAPRRLEHEPAHLSRLCQERNQLQASCQPAVLRRYQSSRAQSNTRCFCTSQGRRLRGTNNGFSWFNLSSSWTHTTHSPDCPLSRYTQQRNDVLELKYTYCTRLLGFSVAAILSTTRRGGLPELTSNLIFRAIVSPDSPAFRLVRSGYLYPLDRTEKMATTLDHAGCILRRELETLFRTGKAHPKDVLPNGKTLLHCVMKGLTWKTFKVDTVLAVNHLVQGLVRAGAEPTIRDDFNESILHVALYKLLNRPLSEDLPKQRLQSEDDICGLLALLLNNGLSIDEEIVFRGRFNIFGEAWVLRLVRQTITHLPDYQRHGTIELSEALEAIYLQDEKMLKKALERHPESVNQPFPWNRTLLYKSLIWPRGMSILLAAGAAGAADRDILEHACYLENVSAISLLLNHECPITWLGPICKINNLEIQKLVVYHLTRRRKRLRDLTVGTLSDTELQTLNLGEDRLLDAQADVAIAVLSRNGIKVAPALLPYTLRRTTVYHCVPLNIELANLLYDAGFRDCDELNAHGMSPFWAHVQGDVWNPLEKLPFLAWLRSKGVDIYRRHPVGRMMATHAVGRLLGDSRLWYDMRRMSSEQEEQASLFLGDDTTDDCDCACSRTGCQALAFALADCGPFTHPFRCNPEIDINFSCCLQLLQLVNSHVFENQWIPSKAIRAMSFSCLELTHTCHASLILWQCDRLSVKAPMSMDEIGEIQEEEYSLIQQLEDLVDEFEAKFHELGIPLIQFLVECWKPRMEEVLKVNSEQKEAEERRMRELGIIVRRDSGVEEIEDTEDVETEDEDEVSAGDDEG